jgi:hypothetical protein
MNNHRYYDMGARHAAQGFPDFMLTRYQNSYLNNNLIPTSLFGSTNYYQSEGSVDFDICKRLAINSTGKDFEVLIEVEDREFREPYPTTVSASINDTYSLLSIPLDNSFNNTEDSLYADDNFLAYGHDVNSLFSVRLPSFSVSASSRSFIDGSRFVAEASLQMFYSYSESVTANVYNVPMHFRTSNSYSYDFTSSTFYPLSTSNFMQSIVDENMNLPSLFPTVQETDSDSNSVSSGSGSAIISPFTYTVNPKSFQVKLLNKEDADICFNEDVNNLDEAFYDSINSPTLEEAITAGGAQYWGVLIIRGAPYTTLSTDVNCSCTFTATDDPDLVNNYLFIGAEASVGMNSYSNSSPDSETNGIIQGSQPNLSARGPRADRDLRQLILRP